MRRFLKVLAAGSALLYVAPLLAAPGGVQGTWCAVESGETMFIESETIGFNEHTVCTSEEPLPEATRFEAELNCANYYVQGDEVIAAFEKTIRFEAELVAKNLLQVRIEDAEQPAGSIEYQRCQR